MKYLASILLLLTVAFAYDSLRSLHDYTGRDLTVDKDWKSVSKITVYASCFSQESPREIFPPKMTGVTFSRCNLDNVILPDGNTMEDCSNRFFKSNPQDSGYDDLTTESGNFFTDKDGNYMRLNP